MKVPFLDLKRVNSELKTQIDAACLRVIDSGWYLLGKVLEDFEGKLKHYLVGEEQGFVVGCNSGTDALILSLLASEVKSGDQVIVVSHTAIPTISAIRAVGAEPVFVDIDRDTWVMDVSQAFRAITPRTKAIIPVHLYGNMVDVYKLREGLVEIGRQDISIIEDVAQAHGAKLSKAKAGTIGRFGAFSFYPSKNIGALGDGGAVFCRDRNDMEKLRMLRNYGQKDRYLAVASRGINSRLDEIQAAVLEVKLPNLDRWIDYKSKLMSDYRKELFGLPVTLQRTTAGCEPAWHLGVIAVQDRSQRDDLISYLEKQGIQTLIHYPIPTHLQEAFRIGNTSLPHTETLAGRILSLPMNTAITQNEQEVVVKAIKSFFAV